MSPDQVPPRSIEPMEQVDLVRSADIALGSIARGVDRTRTGDPDRH